MKERAWNDYEAFEKLNFEKPYSQLSTDELKLVNQFVSEHEYQLLRTSGLEMKRWFRENPVRSAGDKTLSTLKREFKQAHQPSISFAWWKISMGYATAALVFGLGGWWVGQSEKPAPLTKVESILVRDTIYVATKPDTIYTERVVYKDRQVILTRNAPVEEKKSSGKNGINMKEKEELEKLLVSGTE